MAENTAGATGGVGHWVLWTLIGFVGALVLGWIVFPKLLYSRKEQPIRFSHPVHAAQGLACKDCHHLGADGRLAGLPTTASCAECHGEETGEDSPAGREIDRLVKTYVKTGARIPWLVYQYQPDNVFFSHAAHTMFPCESCHPHVAAMDNPPPYWKNRLTGYSRDTMPMWRCERCHASMGVSNACYVCHK